jgi:hypothetical protein
LVKININDQYTERKSSWNVLGVELNEHLKWNPHLEKVIRSTLFVPGLLEKAETFHAVLIEKTTSRIIDFIQTGLLQLPLWIFA